MSFTSEMTSLADAIRAKSGISGKLTIAGMTDAVESIELGGGGSGAGTFDLAKVTEYTPHTPAMTAVTAVSVSGMGTFGDEEDFTAANGTYRVTAETAGETDWKKRVYKHESKEYYLYYEYYDDYPDESTWFFSTSMDSDGQFIRKYNDYDWETDEPIPVGDLESGVYEWGDYDWEPFSVTLDVHTTTVPETPMVLKGVLATGYADGEWSFADTEQSFIGFDKDPKKNYIYAASGDLLVGNYIAFHYSNQTEGLRFYAPLHDDYSDAMGNYTSSVTGGVFEERFGRKALKVQDGTYAEWTTADTSTTRNPLSILCAVSGISYSGWGGIMAMGADTSSMFGLDNFGREMNGRIGYDWGKYGTLSTTAWDTVALTRSDTGLYKMYLNGVQIAETTQSPITAVTTQYITAGFCRGAHKGNVYISDCYVYERELSNEEIAAMHQLVLS